MTHTPETSGALVDALTLVKGMTSGVYDDTDEETYELPVKDYRRLLALVTEAVASATGSAEMAESIVRGWRNRFISAQTELNQLTDGMDYETARLYAEETANEYGAALSNALNAASPSPPVEPEPTP